jgi:hypothetical protein
MRMAIRFRSRAVLGALGIALSLSACEAVELNTTLDTIGTQVDVATTQAGFNLTAVRSFAAMGPRVEAALASYDATLRESGSTGSLLPLLAWNKTFVWDVSTLRYIESARTGAPASGSRFILYSVGGISALPVVPLVEQGYVDITRVQNTATVTVVQAGGTTVMTYDLTTGGTATTPTYSVDGTTGTGTSSTSFSLDVAIAVATGNRTQTWRSATASRGLATTVQYAKGPSSSTVAGVMRAGVRKMEIGGTLGSTGAGALPVKVGGKLYGRVLLSGGTPGTTTITSPLGAPLGAAETTAIAATYAWFASSYARLDLFLAPLYTVMDVAPPA